MNKLLTSLLVFGAIYSTEAQNSYPLLISRVTKKVLDTNFWIQNSNELSRVVGSSSTSSGTNGTNGTNGLDGAQGPQGIPGLPGTNGTNGLDGTNGLNGTNGLDALWKDVSTNALTTKLDSNIWWNAWGAVGSNSLTAKLDSNIWWNAWGSLSSNSITDKLSSNVWQTSWGALGTNALTAKFASNAVFAQKILGSGSTTVTSNSGVYTISSSGGSSSLYAGYGQTLISHPITGQVVPAGGEWLFFNEPFKTWGAAAWPAGTPLVISGLSAYSYRPIWRADIHQERGGLWLWVTNFPGRLTYVYYSQNTTASGSGSLILRTNSWFDIKFWTMAGGAATAITNCERIVGLIDAPALSAGAMPREGAFFISRPAGTGPLTDWAAVIIKGNTVVSSNRLGWGPSTNEWQRLTIAGSSNSLTFYTNGIAAVTVNSLTLETNSYFPVPMYLRTVVTNTSYSFASNSVWIDQLQVKE